MRAGIPVDGVHQTLAKLCICERLAHCSNDVQLTIFKFGQHSALATNSRHICLDHRPGGLDVVGVNSDAVVLTTRNHTKADEPKMLRDVSGLLGGGGFGEPDDFTTVWKAAAEHDAA